MIKTNFNKSDVSILIGNLLDHFDGALYGFLAPVMASSFFPEQDKVVQLILVYSLLATSLFTRPIGTLIFGTIARKYGPMRSMSYSLIGVAFGSVIVALVPGYDILGYGGALLLIVARFFKGIFAAGEGAIAKIYIMEDKNPENSFTASYMYQASSMAGIILASFISTIVLISGHDYLWRICFILGGSVGIWVYILRKYSSSNFKPSIIEDTKKLGLAELWIHKYKLLAIAFSTGLSHITYAIPCIVMNSLVPLISDISMKQMMELNNLLLIFDMILIFLIGPFIRRYNYHNIKINMSILMAISIPIFLLFLPNSNIWYISFVRIWIVFLGVIFMCPQHLFYKKLFEGLPQQYLLIGMSNALGASTIGRLTPVFTLWLWYMSNNIIWIALYIFGIAISTAFFIYKAR